MGEGKKENAKPFDPFEPLREMRDAYLDSMAKVMVETVNTESYAQANGAILDSYLTASAPFREALEKWMVQALQQLSLPSRQEVAALAERFTNMEMRLDDLDAKLDQIAKLIVEARPAVASPPVEPAKSAAPAKSPDSAASKAPAPTKRRATGAQKTTRRQSARKSVR